MTDIHFIINPIAGSGKQKINTDLFSRYFNSEVFTVKVKYSDYKKHATQLTQESIKEGAQIIVACGGDGTINEIASCLINTSIVLGIIPIGSGNGLASNLQIPKDVEKAIKLIAKQSIKKIDVGNINDKYFFSNTGSGFDATVVKHYEASQERKLLCYVKATIKTLRELDYKDEVEVHINNKKMLIKPFMVFISNSNELGYNISLTPKASLQDGLLDVLVVSKISKLKALLFGLLIMIKKQHLLKEVQCFTTKNIKLINTNGSYIQTQIDGESHTIENKTISISILEKSLQVIS